MANGVGLRILSLVVLEFKSPPLHRSVFQWVPDKDGPLISRDPSSDLLIYLLVPFCYSKHR